MAEFRNPYNFVPAPRMDTSPASSATANPTATSATSPMGGAAGWR